jgi:aminoglycoside phosphotransferase (APT) family kinase protein
MKRGQEMNLELFERQMKDWAEVNSNSLGLIASKIEVKYIWNPGGFVNQSYRVSDGESFRHVKLALERKAPRLKKWAMISEHLTNNYYAPQLIEEVTQEIIPGYTYGLIFDFIKGKPLESKINPIPVIEKVLKVLNQLHNDIEIKKAIISGTKTHTYSEAFIEVYITRFEEDLEVIRFDKHLLNFVTEDSIDWFDSEVKALRKIASEKPAFQKEATDVVHNDINWQNVLTDDNTKFWIIDWDDLVVNGDAAMDYSVFLWPLYNSKDWPLWKSKVIGITGNELLERIEFYFRAKLLDEVIDVLADYIDAENVPELKEKTQRRAKEIHLRAYPEYLRLYAK